MRVITMTLGIRVHDHDGDGSVTATFERDMMTGVALKMPPHCVGQVQGVGDHLTSLSGHANWLRVEFA